MGLNVCVAVLSLTEFSERASSALQSVIEIVPAGSHQKEGILGYCEFTCKCCGTMLGRKGKVSEHRTPTRDANLKTLEALDVHRVQIEYPLLDLARRVCWRATL